MKNDVMKHALKREMENVRVSSELKKRILAEVAVSRMPQKRRRMSVMPLAAAAAVVLMIGLTAGVAMLRSEKPDLSATPLSAATVEPDKAVVYVSDGDGLYHWKADCSGIADAHGMMPEEARAEGRKACSACLGEGKNEADSLVWMTSFGDYYHVRHDCSGMTGAVGVLEIEAKTLGRKACPMCISEGVIYYDPEIAATPVPSMVPVLLDDGDEVENAAAQTLPPRLTAPPTEAPAMTVEPGEYAMSTPIATVEPTPEAEEAGASSVAVVMNEKGNMSFWMTKNGVYYHIDEHCSGMEGAHICSEEEAVNAGKILCMVCKPEEMTSEESYAGGFDGPSAVFVTEERSVWMTDRGVYYHMDEHCSGMEDAHACSESKAAESGKDPCPKCLADVYAEMYEEKQSVWMTDAGIYYHTDEHCSGMEGAYGCEVIKALAGGKLPCPKCSKQLADVWTTENGMYYHLHPDCSGMVGAVEIPGTDAVMQGKTLCPNCRKEIVEAAVETARKPVD